MSSLTGFQSMNDMRCEMDDSKIDDDLGKLLQHIKEEQQIVMVSVSAKLLKEMKVLVIVIGFVISSTSFVSGYPRLTQG